MKHPLLQRINLAGLEKVMSSGLTTVQKLKSISNDFNPNFGCCQSMKKVISAGQGSYLAYPLKWLPEQYRVGEKLADLINYTESLLINAKFLGYSNFSPKMMRNISLQLIQQIPMPMNDFKKEYFDLIVTDSENAVFENKTPTANKLEVYYDFCVIRGLFSAYYQPFIIKGYELSKLTNFDNFICFQLAHYQFEHPIPGDKLIYTNGSGRLTPKEGFLSAIRNSNGTLNGCFPTVNNISFLTLHKLFIEQKYDELKKQLS